MNIRFLAVLAALALAGLACSINLDLPNIDVPRVVTGPTETVALSEPAPAAGETADVTINMGAGTLALTGGGAGLVEGEVQYNVADWEPVVTRSGNSVTIRQGDGTVGITNGSQVVNDWSLQLGDVPMRLEMNTGAYQGTVNLSGVPLLGLSIKDGASESEVRFDSLNPEEMDRLSYDTGASTIRLIGLGNANFSEMSFTSGVGDYTLDFSGDWQRDATVTINTGISDMRVVVPAGVSARVVVTGALSNVNTEGTWAKSGDTYETSGAGPALTITIDMGLGSLTLVNQ